MSHSPRRFRSDLNYLIHKHLTAAGIEIPNPQRDLHIRSGTLKVENVTKQESTDDRRQDCRTSVSQAICQTRLIFMQRGEDTIQFSSGRSEGVQLRELQNCDAWKRALQNKCKDYRYYEIVEETLECGFEHHYLLLEDASGNVRAIQPVFFVQQNLVEGVPGKIRSIVDGIRKVFPRFLTMRVLMVGCGAGTGDLGACDEKDEPWVANALQATSSDLRQEKQSFPCRLQGFPGELSLSPRNVGLECLRAHSEHADDAAAAPIRKLGRIFRHT